MYLSKVKIIFSNIVSSVLLLISSFFIFIGIIGFFIELFGFLGASNSEDRSGWGQGLGIAVGVLLFFGSMFVISLARFRFAGKANKFNNVFENNRDGEIPLSSASGMFGITEKKFKKLFDRMIKKGYLVNCYIEYSGIPRIILKNISEQFVALKCPNCGASNNIKKGQTGICEYCHSEIESTSR